MRVAAIYDIHANYSALKAVLEEIRKANIEQVVVGGDLAWGPEPRQVMDLLMDYNDEFILLGVTLIVKFPTVMGRKKG